MQFNLSLSRYILDNTTAKIFERGIDYEHRSKIGQLEELPKKITAVVAGSRPYEVEFRQGSKYVKGYCNCPYARSNADYCKHLVAVAVAWDKERGWPTPNEEEIARSALKIDYGFGSRIKTMYEDPLHADLELLAAATDYGSWVRPHANLQLKTTFADQPKKLPLLELLKAHNKVKAFARRSNFDPYFCAGEVSAIVSLNFDLVLQGLTQLELRDAEPLVIECVTFYFNDYLQMVDGSDGVWQIPQARLPVMLKMLQDRGIDRARFESLGLHLNDLIQGWGDIFETLGVEH